MAFCLLFSGLFAAVARAQTYAWRTAEIGGGGFVTGTVFHPAEQGLVYSRTDVGGAYRLDSATNRWIALNDDIGGLNNEFQHLGVLSLGIDPSDANRLYIATGQYGGTESWKLPSRIYRSSNRGNTWEGYVVPGFKMAGNGEGRGTGERFAVSPVNGSVILLGTSDAGVWRSTDRGVTWARLAGFPAAVTSLNFVLYAPANASGAGPARRVYAAGRSLTSPSLWYSDDNGDTWIEAPNQPGRTAGQEMFALMGSFDAAGTFYVTWGDQTGPGSYQTRYVVSKLAAGASTWTSITPPTGQGGFAGVSADARTAGHVVVTTIHRWWPGDEVYRSTNGGSTWSAVLRSTGTTRSPGNSPWATSAGPHWMTDVDIDPFNSERVIFNTGFGLFQTTNLSAANASRVWTFYNDGLEELVPLGLYSPSVGPALIAATGDYTGFRLDNLNRSPRRGAMQPMNGSNAYVMGAALNSQRMVRQHSTDSLISSDAGATWARFAATPPSAVNGHNRIALSADGNVLLWAPSGSGAYVSTNNGASWTATTGASLLGNSSATLTVATLAGAAGTAGATNASGTAASFSAPEGLAVASDGRRYVADTGNHLIRTIASGGAVSTLAGGAGISGAIDASGTAARFNAPAGIAFGNGFLYVADTGNHLIRQVTTGGVVTTFAGGAGSPGSLDGAGASARFNSPGGIAVDSAGTVYVADTANHIIRKISPAGVVVTLAGTAGASGSANGVGAAARFSSPRGIAVNASGVVYVADTGNHVIRAIATDGTVTTLAGTPGSSGSTNGTGAVARFNAPRGIAVDASGIIHVADTGNQTIRRITAAGAVTTVAGTAGSAGTTDGSNTTARFNAPSGVAVQPDGYYLYIADTASHTVRRATAYLTLIPFADATDKDRLYLWNSSARTLLASTNAGASFSVTTTTLPSTLQQIRPVPGRTGQLWARAGADGLYQSSNYGASFTKLTSVTEVYQFDFGRAAPGAAHPAVFIWGRVGGVLGFFRSDNAGSSWTRINTNLQQFGYINDMAGDPRVYGRVYLGTSGRGVVVGELVPATPPASQTSVLVFGDALGSGWTNASTSGVVLTSTTTIRRGSAAAFVPAQTSTNSYTFAVNTAARSTVGMGAISFWASAGAGSPLPPLRVGASRGGVALEAYPVTTPNGVGWQRVVVPLADLGLDNIDDLTGLRIEAYAVNSVLPGAVSLDDVALLGSADYTTPTQISFSGLSVPFDGSPKSAVVTTTPEGRGLVVTYNGSTTPPSAVGSYLVLATLQDPFAVGSASATFTIGDASASIQFTSLSATADGTPKQPGVTTTPAGLTYSITYDGSGVAPALAGRYAVVATITDPRYTGSTTATFVIRQPDLAPTDITGWTSNIAGKIASGAGTASPLFVPDDTTDSFSSNTLQARFPSIRLLNEGDTITLTGSFQLSADGVANASNWFRFGLFDHQGQAADVVTGWLGGASVGGNYWERTSVSGLFTTGTGATQRAPDASPAPVSSASPSGRPPVAFTATVTRTATGVVHGFQLRRTDTNVVLLSYNVTDTTPNNNGTLNGAVSTAAGYSPIYNTAGFSFGRTYLGASGAQAQFSNVRVSFTSASAPLAQSITFAQPADRPLNSAPFALAATASSGLPVSFNVVSGPATLSGNTLTLTGAGVVTIRATQTGNANYEAAAPVDQSFVSTKLPATITLSGLGTYYNGGVKLPNVATSPAGLAVTFTFNGSATTPSAVGTYDVVATINDASYQGSTSGIFVIEPGPQSITFPVQQDRGVGATFSPGATASSGLPVSYVVVSGPAETNGSTVTITGLGSVTLRASQPGNSNYLPAASVDRLLNAVAGSATVTLGALNTMYDGQPKAVAATTTPPGLAVSITYDGSPTPPAARGSYAIVATVNDSRYQGSANGTLVISARTSGAQVTGWRVTNSTTIAAANTGSPLLNAGNGVGTAGASVPFYAFFDPVTLSNVGDAVRITGSATVNAPAGTAGQGQWLRFGLFDNRNQASTAVMNWLGYTAMANGSASGSLHEKIGNQSSGDFGSSIFGTASRTVDASPAYVGANSPSGVVTLSFEQTITRQTAGVTVVSRLIRPGTGGAADTVYLSSTYTDSTPNNNGLASGDQSAPLNPVYSPRYNAVGVVFSGAYLGATNNSSVQFSNVTVNYTANSDGAPPTISFPALDDRPYSATPIALTAQSSAGLPVVISVVSGPAALSGGNLTLTGVGTVTLRAEQAGTLTILPATPVERSFEVTKAPAQIVISGLLAQYDGTEKAVSVTTTPANLPFTITYSGSPSAPSSVGSYAVVATVDDPLYEGAATANLVIQAPLATWTGSGAGSLAWSNPANWSSSTPPVSGRGATVALFTGSVVSAGLTTINQDLPAPFSLHQLELDGQGPASLAATVRMTGSPLRFVPDGSNGPVILLNASAGAGLSYDLALNIESDADLTLEGPGSAGLLLSGAMTGSGGLIQQSETTVTLSGNATYAGPTTLVSGTLAISGTLAGTESVVVGPGARLENTGVIQTSNVSVLGGGRLGGAGTLRGNLTIDGEVVVLGPGTWRVEGDVTNRGVLRIANGARIEVTGTLVNQGRLDLIAADTVKTIGSLTGTGAVLDASSFRVAPPITLNGSGVNLDVRTFVGHRFQLQRSTTLQADSWINVGGPIAGTDGVLRFTDPAGITSSRQFYRVIIVP